MIKREDTETYKSVLIAQYDDEPGYRADLGAKRSKQVPTVQEARDLIDFIAPKNWSEE